MSFLRGAFLWRTTIPASQLLQLILSGLTTGSIYALIALGFVTIYNVTGIINFAQGEFAMLGAMLAVSLLPLGLPPPLVFLLAVAGVVLIGAGLERMAIHPARRASPVTLIIITIGADIAIRGIALLIWGTDPYPLPAFTAGPPLVLAGAVLTRQAIWIMGTTAVALALLAVFFERTYLGKAVRACAINRLSARLTGIRPDRMSLLAFALSAGLGAVGGIVIAPMTLVSYDMGLALGLRGFVAAIMGGMVSPPGAVLGALLLGVLEALVAGLFRAAFKEAFAFLVLFLILILRPQGLFGRGAAREAGL
ncbi:MAG TPA: branched-chain amino acid ABC transporter permease [Candidatus Methylomirabilis sp.]|nr:branched-chain amino acid ABC transporter permease [Candidatus Methylomirabilis sp.]